MLCTAGSILGLVDTALLSDDALYSMPNDAVVVTAYLLNCFQGKHCKPLLLSDYDHNDTSGAGHKDVNSKCMLQ